MTYNYASQKKEKLSSASKLENLFAGMIGRNSVINRCKQRDSNRKAITKKGRTRREGEQRSGLREEKLIIYIDESLFEEFQFYIRERYEPDEKRVLSKL